MAVMALVLIGSAAPSTFISTTQATPGAVKLINSHSFKALSVSGWDKQADGALIQQFTNVNANYQEWYLENLGNGYYHIRNVASGDMLDVSGSSTSDGTNVIQWPNNDGWNQQWQLIPVLDAHSTGDAWKIKNRNSGKLLEISGQSTSDGGQAIQWEDNGGYNQQWYFLS